MHEVIEKLRLATEGGDYEGRVYLVGGIVRDKQLAAQPDDDIDIVIEGDAAELARFFFESGIADHPPITYPRFGTAMLSVSGRQVEIVGARKESYDPTSRRPSTERGSLLDDVLRRDFTINTLLENLHTGEVLDLTGKALADIRSRIIRTPKDPLETFDDDPLRMLRAIRFASRLDFTIDPDTLSALRDRASRLAIVSAERISAEFVKIVMSPNAARGLEMLRETGLLQEFAPELAAMHGVSQNVYHIYDVWTHSLKTLELIPAEAGMILKLAALLHDIGKVETKTADEQGAVHFYRHEAIGAEMARHLMQRMKFSNSNIGDVAFLISMHLRVGEYDNRWTDSAVRRLIRDAGDHLEDLVRLTAADKGAANPDMECVDLDAFEDHVRRVKDGLSGQKIRSPLDGREIIELLGLPPGPEIAAIKEYLEGQIVEGTLLPGDKMGAAELLLREYRQTSE